MKNTYPAFPNTQRGATLLLALLVLIMITMHGIPTVMNNTLNERMGGNTRNRDLAFQTAEHALKDAESIFPAGQTTVALNLLFDPNSDGNCADHATGYLCNGDQHANDIAYWRDDFTWYSDDEGTTCNHLSPPDLPNQDGIGFYAEPCYVVERITDPSAPPCVPIPPNTTPLPTSPPTDCIAVNGYNKKHYYRVTARGVGKERDAVVILQTIYEFTE